MRREAKHVGTRTGRYSRMADTETPNIIISAVSFRARFPVKALARSPFFPICPLLPWHYNIRGFYRECCSNSLLSILNSEQKDQANQIYCNIVFASLNFHSVSSDFPSMYGNLPLLYLLGREKETEETENSWLFPIRNINSLTIRRVQDLPWRHSMI